LCGQARVKCCKGTCNLRSCNDRFATSDQNLDIVRSQYERFNERRIKAFVDALDSQVVFEPGPEAGPYRITCVGREAVKQFFKRLSKTVRRFRAVPIRVLEKGDDVFVLVRMYGKFKGGIEAWLPVIHRWTIREGMIIGWRSFPGRGKSFEIAVLELVADHPVSPESMPAELEHAVRGSD
jgi:ketosteroid isomerase-like protein